MSNTNPTLPTKLQSALQSDNAKILVQRADRLGDLVLALPVIESLKNAYPHAKIYLLCSERNIKLTHHLPFLEDVIEFNIHRHPSLKEKRELINHINSISFTLYVSLWSEPFMEKIAYKTNIPYSLGAKRSFLSSYFLTHAIPLNWSDITKHEISFNLNLIKPLNIPLTNQPKLYNISPFDISTKKPICLFFCTRGSSNDPLSDKMISDCIETLITENIYHIVLTYGGENSQSPLHSYEHPNITNLKYPLDLPELIALINACELYIGPDTGPSHIAWVLNKKCLIVFKNPTNPPSRWGPYNDYFKLIRYDYIYSSSLRYTKEIECIYDSIKNLTALSSPIHFSDKQRINIQFTLRILWICKTIEEFKRDKYLIKDLKDRGWVVIPHIKRRSLIKNIKKLKQKMTYRHINTFILSTYTFMIPLLRLWAYSQAKPQFIFKFKSNIKKEGDLFNKVLFI